LRPFPDQACKNADSGRASPQHTDCRTGTIKNVARRRVFFLNFVVEERSQRVPQSCSVCRHPQRSAIDTALVENQPLRDIAKRFGTTPASVHRHKQHLPVALTKAKQAQEVARATTLLDQVESLIGRLETITEQAQKDRAWSAAAGAIREMRGCLTLLAQMRGELASDVQVST
jgi:hypothetical protein